MKISQNGKYELKKSGILTISRGSHKSLISEKIILFLSFVGEQVMMSPTLISFIYGPVRVFQKKYRGEIGVIGITV